MGLVDLALACSPEDRQPYVRGACGQDSHLFEEVWKYVEWEERMQGFLLDPLLPAPRLTRDFDPGEVLEGRFRILRKVGEGGMGVVYEAWDQRLERRIALKCAKPGFRKRLPPEVRNASTIAHPNVCKIFEIHTAATDEGEIDFITMEFLAGETLAERLRRGRVPEKEARAIALQLCDGLTEAHSKQVIHGDLKSNNVILVSEENGTTKAVITDFGLARSRETTRETIQSGAWGGTPDYMAPELWRGEKASEASDLYALGVILYELASGRKPYSFAPETPWEEQIAGKPPSANPKWDRVLSRCLEADPARRFRDAGEVSRALKPRSRVWILAAAAAVLLAVASGLVTYEKATAPGETVRLAVLPFEGPPEMSAAAQSLFRATAAEIGHLKSGSRVKFYAAPLDLTLHQHVDTIESARSLLGSTHVLRVAIGDKNSKIVIHASLIHTQSGTAKRGWELEYDPENFRFAPVALAGIVSFTWRLPPLAAAAAVNAAATPEYRDGLAALRWYSGVDAALYLFGRAVAADPDSPLTHAGLAEAEWLKYALTKDKSWLDRTVDSVRLAQSRNPDVSAVHAVAGLLEANSGAYLEAIAEYQRAIELDPKNGDAYRRLGAVYDSNNQPDQALIALQEATRVQPDYFKPFQNLGAFYRRRGNYPEAVQAFQKMISLAPDLSDGHFALGVVFTDMGRFAEAEKEIRVSIALQDTAQAEHDLGYILMNEGNDTDAIAHYLRALSLGPDNDFLLWLNLGISRHRAGFTNDAQAAFRRGLGFADDAVQRDPHNGKARAYLAYLCARVGDSRRAESEVAQALQFSPNDKITRLTAAETYEALGLREATLELLQTTQQNMLPGLLAELSRYPEVAALRKDPRFLQLMASNHVQ